MAAPHCKAPAVADWHSASKPIEDADVEHLAQVLLGTVRSVDLYKGAGWLMDTTAARVLFYACPSPKLWPTAESTAYNNISNR
jgi:hypothetical protein